MTVTWNEFGGYWEGDPMEARINEYERRQELEEREFEAMERVSKLYAEMAKEFADNYKSRRWHSLMRRAEGLRSRWHETEAIPFSGADENPPVFGRRWRIAADGFGLQRDDLDGSYVHIDDALSVLHQSARLSAPQAAGQWLPIETAPDNMDERVAVRWVDSDGQEHRDLDYKEDGCWMGWHDHAEHVEIIGGHGVSYTPPYEHWMCLPPTPAGEGG